MTSKPHRTRPLDRDGDGRDGGSLPGNKTAPYADAQIDQVTVDEADSLPLDDLADARTTPGDSPEKLEAIERETDEANDAARASAEDAAQGDTFSTEEIEAAPAVAAVRARELRLLLDSRRLYKSDQGYSATYGAPYVDQAVIDSWIEAGLAEFDATAGICGGVKPTHEARRHLGQLTLAHYAPGTVGAAAEDAA